MYLSETLFPSSVNSLNIIFLVSTTFSILMELLMFDFLSMNVLKVNPLESQAVSPISNCPGYQFLAS